MQNVLMIEKYEGALEEPRAKDSAKTLLVTKRYPMKMKIGSIENVVNFRDVTVDASLQYHEKSGAAREVTFVKTNPMEWKCRPTSNGCELDVDIKFQVLSSQHQGSLFFIQFQMHDISSNIIYELKTLPLRIVSKIDKHHAMIAAAATSTKKAPTTDSVSGVLHRMEINERHKTRMISTLCNSFGVTHQEQGHPTDLDSTVKKLCSAFKEIPKGEKNHRISCELQALNDDDLFLLLKIVDTLHSSLRAAITNV